MPLPFPTKPDIKNQTLKGPILLILLLDYSNQGGWHMSISLKGCYFEHTEMSKCHFESFNDECAIVKKAMNANLLNQESKLTRVLTCS